MKHTFTFAALLALAVALPSCQSVDAPLISLGLQDLYIVPRMQKVGLKPAFTGDGYMWTEILPDGRDSLVSTSKDYIFLKENPGTYKMRFDIIDPSRYMREEITFLVIDEQVEYREGISFVYDYCPAPGQFVNTMPDYEAGDDAETMRRKALEVLLSSNGGVSLGGYGGYITFGFDHTVMNLKDQRDFEVYGNSFYSSISEATGGGSNEPGIVMVSFDANLNGVPDDEWYELAGSEYYKASTIKDYRVSYFRPSPDKLPTPGPSYLNDTTYIRWEDNQQARGHVSKNVFHDQSYWPLWIDRDTLVFEGTKLPDNYFTVSGAATLYVQVAYDWGYVDNHPNQQADGEGHKLSSFDIEWAVDKKGNKVHLPGVDFVRVYTAVNQYCGWLGETSTEVYGAKSLHVGYTFK